MVSELDKVYFAFVFIAFGGLLFGYVIGVNSNLVTEGQLLCEQDSAAVSGTWLSLGHNQCYELSAFEQGVVSSLTLIGACVSSLFCFRYADYMGRKLEVQLGALFYAAGAALASASPNLLGVFLGLTTYGVGVGFAMHAAPLYIAEISPANVRGMLVSAKEAIIVFGIFLGFLAGCAFSGIAGTGWRLMIGMAALLAVAMTIGISAVPESPRFLVLKVVRDGALLGPRSKLMDEARAALSFYRSSASAEAIDEELNAIYTDATASVGSGAAGTQSANPFQFPLPLLIGCGLVFLQQVTGQPSVLYFATNIFKSAGFGSGAALSSLVVGFVKLVATLFTVWRVDQYGRRLLLFVGITMMAVALLLLTVAFRFRTCIDSEVPLSACKDNDIRLTPQWALATVVALMVYVSGYQVGFGPISWLMISEIFPLSVRGAALSLAAMVNFGSNIAMTLTQKVLLDALTPSGVFGMYFALSLVSIAFVWAIVPETKGKTLEQIERDLLGRGQSSGAQRT